MDKNDNKDVNEKTETLMFIREIKNLTDLPINFWRNTIFISAIRQARTTKLEIVENNTFSLAVIIV